MEEVNALLEETGVQGMLDMHTSHLQVLIKSDKIFLYLLQSMQMEQRVFSTFLA